MSNKNKKQIVAILLALSSLLSGWLLLTYNTDNSKAIREFSTIDSLLQRHFTHFNVKSNQITQVHLPVDSNFTRKEYHIQVSPAFSQTQFHANLNRRLFPYGIDTPANVDLENRTMRIHLYYEGTVIRTVYLRMDPSLIRERSPASILVSFEEAPSKDALQQLISFGEPIPLVFQVTTALEAKNLKNAYIDQYKHLAFWFTDKEGQSLLRPNTQPSDLEPLRRFGKISPQSKVLSFLPDASGNTAIDQYLKKIPLTFIQADRAIRVNFEEEERSFNRVLERFEKKARNRRHPILLLHNSGNLLEKTHEAILQFKKRGLMILKPPLNTFGKTGS